MDKILPCKDFTPFMIFTSTLQLAAYSNYFNSPFAANTEVPFPQVVLILILKMEGSKQSLISSRGIHLFGNVAVTKQKNVKKLSAILFYIWWANFSGQGPYLQAMKCQRATPIKIGWCNLR